MARFVQQKDLAFFEKISKELVDVVVQTTVEIFKLSISESKTKITTTKASLKLHVESTHEGTDLGGPILYKYSSLLSLPILISYVRADKPLTVQK